MISTIVPRMSSKRRKMRATKKTKTSVASRSWPKFLEKNTVRLGQIDQVAVEPKSKRRKKTTERETKLYDMKINYI